MFHNMHAIIILTYIFHSYLQIVDLLWSDPRPQPGCIHNGYRGGGCFFGPEVTQSFLQRHQLQLLVRSHQCKSDGYEYTHDHKVRYFLHQIYIYRPTFNVY